MMLLLLPSFLSQNQSLNPQSACKFESWWSEKACERTLSESACMPIVYALDPWSQCKDCTSYYWFTDPPTNADPCRLGLWSERAAKSIRSRGNNLINRWINTFNCSWLHSFSYRRTKSNISAVSPYRQRLDKTSTGLHYESLTSLTPAQYDCY